MRRGIVVDALTAGPLRRRRRIDRELRELLSDPVLVPTPVSTRRAAPTSVRSSRRPSGLFLAFLAIAVGAGVLAWCTTSGSAVAPMAVFAFIVASWIVTLCLHEFAHAWVGWRGGDDSVQGAGYLTLNPLRYGHPLLSVALPLMALVLGGIGLPGGAVRLHSHRFYTRAWDSAVSAAGPAVNLLVAALAILAAHLGAGAGPHVVFWSAVAFAVWLQLCVAVLNLLPVPGLDGWGIVEPYVPSHIRAAAAKLAPLGPLLLFLLLGLSAAGAAFAGVISELATVVGLPLDLVQSGAELVRFWRH